MSYSYAEELAEESMPRIRISETLRTVNTLGHRNCSELGQFSWGFFGFRQFCIVEISFSTSCTSELPFSSESVARVEGEEPQKLVPM